MTRRWGLIVAGAGLCAMLGACHESQKPGHGTISGEILPGSVSDAMLPYDSARSKPPLAPGRQAGGPADMPAQSADSADAAPASSTPDSAAPAATDTPPVTD